MITDYIDPNAVNIVIVEHGKPEFPTKSGESCLLGTMNVPLSQQGEGEAKKLRDLMKESKLVAEYILTSDLTRASATAEILAKGLHCKASKLPALREGNKGDLQGLTREERKDMPSALKYKENKTARERFFAKFGEGPEVESKADLARKNLVHLINELRKEPTLKGKTVILVTHGNPIKIAHTLAENHEHGSLDTNIPLEESLKTIRDLGEPGSCEMFLFKASPNFFSFSARQKIGEEVSTDPLGLKQ